MTFERERKKRENSLQASSLLKKESMNMEPGVDGPFWSSGRTFGRNPPKGWESMMTLL
jgi:hypothetical protein